MAVTFQLIMSLDGYVAGPNQSVEDPLGVGMARAFVWFFELEVWRRMQGMQGEEANESTAVIEEARANVGAYVMGRNMFGGGHGPWPDGTGPRSTRPNRPRAIATSASRVEPIRCGSTSGKVSSMSSS
jgi:hypothetical protein